MEEGHNGWCGRNWYVSTLKDLLYNGFTFGSNGGSGSRCLLGDPERVCYVCLYVLGLLESLCSFKAGGGMEFHKAMEVSSSLDKTII